MLAVGHNFMIAILKDNRVCSCGNNYYGQLGLGDDNDHDHDYYIPMTINFFQDKYVEKIVCGQFHVFAIDIDNFVYAWGSNEFGELGLGDYDNRKYPQCVNFFKNQKTYIHGIKCRTNTSYAIDIDGNVYIWGHGYQNMNTPYKVLFSDDVVIKKIYCGSQHMHAIDTNNNIYALGRNCEGQLGLGNHDSQDIPQLVEYFQDKCITKIICTDYATLAFSYNDIYFCGKDYINNYEVESMINTPQPINYFKNVHFTKILYQYNLNKIFAVDMPNKIYYWDNGIAHNIILNQYIEISKIIANMYIIYILTNDNNVYSLENNIHRVIENNEPTLMEYFQENRLRTKRKYCRIKSANNAIH